jgi:hypothetical protein
MAKILLGSTIGDARNKAGSIVYSKNRFGAYMRSKVSPVQPRSVSQAGVRSNFATLSKSWQGLTPTQQAGWTALASVNPVRDVFGNTQVLTGAQFYVRVNRNLSTVGLTLLSDAPANQLVDAPTSATLTATSGGTPALSLAYAPAVEAGDGVIVRITPQLSAGRTFFSPFLKKVFGSAAGLTSPLDLLSAYNTLFGGLSAGQKIFGDILYIGPNGAAAVPLPFSAVVG